MGKIRLPGIFILCFLLFSGTVSAEEQTQSPLQMDELTIQVLPEYTYHPQDEKKEHTPLLIGYHGTLHNTTDEAQKGQIQIPLPVDEENFKIGFIGNYSGDLSEIHPVEYELDLENGMVTWEMTEEVEPEGVYKFVIEYYTNSIQESGNEKSFTFDFKAFTDIGILRTVFVEPLKTESFNLDPAPTSHQENTYGMNMFVFMDQSVEAGDEKTVQIQYEREETRTTEEMLMAMAEYSAKHSERKNDSTIPLWEILIVVGGVTVAGAGLLFIFLKRKNQQPKAENMKKAEQQSATAKEEAKIATLRSLLLSGEITEEEYRQMMERMGEA